jgi:CRISPR-associated protein Csd1
MILQSLKDYYDRKAAEQSSGIAPKGWERKELSFIIVLDKNGSFRFEDMREGDGKKKHGKSFLVPLGVKKSSGIAPNLLWDPYDYIFGSANDKRNKEKTEAFLNRIKKELVDTDKKSTLIHFLETITMSDLEKNPHWKEIVETKALMSFRFEDELNLYCRNSEVANVIDGKTADENNKTACLVTGEKDIASKLHTAIKGVWGAQTSGANIVSFNREAFCSFEKEQGQNAPVGETAMFAYTTALNTLLDKNSSQRMQIGDASTVFWSDRKTFFETDFLFFLAEPPKDDPDVGTRAIKNLFDSVKSGGYVEDKGNEKFFILGLSPNAARISIRFWKTGTVSEFAKNIRKHFNDLEIVKPPNEPKYYSLWRLLVNSAVQDKSENIPPNIAGDFMHSIINGAQYPATILQLVLRRIKSDGGNVKPVRAALVKAYLNRKPNQNEKELSMALDKEQPSKGYQLGRLFASLEKIQEEANPSLNATIRERYYGAACSSPVTVFSTLLRLKNHHLAKFENKGRKIYFESLIGEIMEYIKASDAFPAHLDLHEQGKFAIGYYHQRQDFFTKKTKEAEND